MKVKSIYWFINIGYTALQDNLNWVYIIQGGATKGFFLLLYHTKIHVQKTTMLMCVYAGAHVKVILQKHSSFNETLDPIYTKQTYQTFIASMLGQQMLRE